MTTMRVSARGQVTFGKDVLKHLGIQPGDKIRLELLPDGRAELRAERPTASFAQLHGLLRNKTNGVRLSIDDINDAIAEAGTGAK